MGWKRGFRRREENVTHPQNGLWTSKLSAGYTPQVNLGFVRETKSPLMRLPKPAHSFGLGLAKGQLD